MDKDLMKAGFGHALAFYLRNVGVILRDIAAKQLSYIFRFFPHSPKTEAKFVMDKS